MTMKRQAKEALLEKHGIRLFPELKVAIDNAGSLDGMSEEEAINALEVSFFDEWDDTLDNWIREPSGAIRSSYRA